MVEDKLSHHHYAFRRQSVQLRQPVSESIQGVTGTLGDLVASGDGIEPLPHHHVNRGLQAVTNIVQVTAIRDHFIDPAVYEVRHEFDLLIDDRDPLEVVEESLFVSGIPRGVQVPLGLLSAAHEFCHRRPHCFNPATLKT